MTERGYQCPRCGTVASLEDVYRARRAAEAAGGGYVYPRCTVCGRVAFGLDNLIPVMKTPKGNWTWERTNDF